MSTNTILELICLESIVKGQLLGHNPRKYHARELEKNDVNTSDVPGLNDRMTPTQGIRTPCS